MPSFLPVGKAGGLRIRRCQGLAVDDYGFAPGALAPKASDFCNIGVCRDQVPGTISHETEVIGRRSEEQKIGR